MCSRRCAWLRMLQRAPRACVPWRSPRCNQPPLRVRVPTATNTLRVPRVFHVGPMPGRRGSFIVMEALALGGSANQAELGRQLARMHLAEPAVRSAPALAVVVCAAAWPLNALPWCLHRMTTRAPASLGLQLTTRSALRCVAGCCMLLLRTHAR